MLPSKSTETKTCNKNNNPSYVSSCERLRQSHPMPHSEPKPGPSSSHQEGTHVKEELKIAIQNRRASQGLDVLSLPITTEKKVSYQLSAEERMKIMRRRERNKVAASRCREKKKQRLDELQREADGLEDSNNELAREIANLRAEVDILATNLRNHKCVLTSGKTSTLDTPSKAFKSS
ncbi:jun dimerization protein 2-like [Actinia tenebrosa]|uniref:Jun dimerization protein 2-like n=1 Tax=Actinia tenebrosa TaxID=6105 RepID=A0A6P8J0N5_ACTTE|nr:jun dimerization protein 2-like [Actinia tenebrosa]